MITPDQLAKYQAAMSTKAASDKTAAASLDRNDPVAMQAEYQRKINAIQSGNPLAGDRAADLSAFQAEQAKWSQLQAAQPKKNTDGTTGPYKAPAANVDVQLAANNAVGALETGKQYAMDTIKTGTLGSLDENAVQTGRSLEMSDIIARRKQALSGMSDTEMQTQRDIQGQAINRSTQTAQRQLQTAQAGAGVRGGTASMQQLQAIMGGMQAKAGMERDLQMQNAEAKRNALNSYEASLTTAESSEFQKQAAKLELQKFNLAQRAKEQGAQLSLAMGIGSMALGSVASDKAIGAQERAGQAGGGGGKIICTELFHQGIMPVGTYLLDQEFGKKLEKECPHILDGYQCWAKYIVKGMQKSKLFTKVVAKLAMPWANHMAGQKNIVGAVVMSVGLRICGALGRLRILIGVK